jgi:flagellar protein FliO/FliZ
MSDNALLLIRVGFSFTVVLCLMWVAARVLRNRTGGRPTDAVEVLARTQLGRNTNVTVLRVADRALVLGVSEGGIVQLGDPITDLGGLRAAVPAPRTSDTVVVDDVKFPTAAPSAPQAMAGQGALAGSILSPATWRMGMDALRERTVRRG